jgi:hypothetical protein
MPCFVGLACHVPKQLIAYERFATMRVATQSPGTLQPNAATYMPEAALAVVRGPIRLIGYAHNERPVL